MIKYNSPHDIGIVYLVNQLMKESPVDAIGTILRLPTWHVKEDEISKFGVRVSNIEDVLHSLSSTLRLHYIIHMLGNLTMFSLFIIIVSDRVGI